MKSKTKKIANYARFVYSTKMSRQTCFVDINKACAWLENELPTHSEMTPHSIKFFVECFRSNFTNKNK